MREALHYQHDEQRVACCLCPKECVIPEGKTGFCRVRRNRGGILYAENYAACSSSALDPIEKKPLYHFYPGSTIVSLGTWGCNFACRFCQNWQIAQDSPQTRTLLPQQAAELAAYYKNKGNIGIAYTYSEPSVWYEYILDTAQAVSAAGMKNILVTNGYINPKPLAELLPYIDAMNIDVKAYQEEFYRNMCSGGLEAVKRTVETASRHCHVEITTLLVPGYNDTLNEINRLAEWLAGIDSDIPLHLSRYFPNYKLDLPPTPPETMIAAKDAAQKQLNYVYLGNIGGEGINTYCPKCGKLVIDRMNRKAHVTPENHCPACDWTIAVHGQISF